MDKKYIIFDLDGTIVDSGKGIKNAIRYSLKSIGIDENREDILNNFIGPPLKDSYMKYYGLNEEEAIKIVNTYREYYSDKGIFEASIYKGIDKVIIDLKDKGNDIILATSKPKVFAEKILKYFDLKMYFDFIGGASLDHKISQKEEVLKYVINQYKINPQYGFMIGDTRFDILGGRMFNLNTIGVTYGYGSLEELEESKADNIVNKPLEILEIVK